MLANKAELKKLRKENANLRKELSDLKYRAGQSWLANKKLKSENKKLINENKKSTDELSEAKLLLGWYVKRCSIMRQFISPEDLRAEIANDARRELMIDGGDRANKFLKKG